ncbi:MAG: hypothetical protein ACLFSR_03835 [Halomonas sp.]
MSQDLRGVELPEDFPRRGPVVVSVRLGVLRLLAEVFQTRQGIVALESGWQDSGGRFFAVRGARLEPATALSGAWNVSSAPREDFPGGPPSFVTLDHLGTRNYQLFSETWEEFLPERERWGLTRELAREVLKIDQIEAGEITL